MRHLINIWVIAKREMKILTKNPIYLCCMVVFPLLTMLFFTSMLDEGVPQEMPVGVVDLDNSSTSRALVRRLDGFQTSRVVAHYASVAEARHAMQQNDIYDSCISPRALPTICSLPVVRRCHIIIVMCR